MNADKDLWNVVLKLWMFPRVAEPVIHKTKEESSREIGDEIAGFSFRNHSIHISKPNLEQRAGIECLPVILKHEVGHYALAPYSLGRMLLLNFEAGQVLKGSSEKVPKADAQLVQNLFTDLIVNTYIAQKDSAGMEDLVEMYQNLNRGDEEKGKLWQLYMRAYEHILDTKKGMLAGNVDNATDKDAIAIKNLVLDDLCNSARWQKKIRKFASIVKDYLPENQGIEFALIDNPDLEKELRKLGYAPGMPENKMPPEIRKIIREMSKEISNDKFKKLAAEFGFGSPSTINKWIYEAVASGYSVSLPEVMTQSGELYPHSPTEWEAGDDPEELDVPYSFGESGVLVPGLTTQKWRHRESTSWKPNKEHVDLAIVLDTSGSMADPRKMISYAHLSAMVVGDSALNTGNKVAFINFAGEGDMRVTKHTEDRTLLHDEMMKYFGSGTCFPTTKLIDLISSRRKKQHLFVITDTGFWDEGIAVRYLEEAYNIAGGGGTLFLSYGREGGIVDKFRSIGYNVHQMSRAEDLLAVTRKTAQELYG